MADPVKPVDMFGAMVGAIEMVRATTAPDIRRYQARSKPSHTIDDARKVMRQITADQQQAHLRMVGAQSAMRQAAQSAPDDDGGEGEPLFEIDGDSKRIRRRRVDILPISDFNKRVLKGADRIKHVAAEIGVHQDEVKDWNNNAIWALAAWQRSCDLSPTGKLNRLTMLRLFPATQ